VAVAEPLVIRYRFTFDDGAEHTFEVQLDPVTLLNQAEPPPALPGWTRLEVEQCPNCPLRDRPHCPTAASLAGLIKAFAEVLSFTTATVRVNVRGRELSKRTSVQSGLSALLGVYMTTSGCPVLAKLRPMVRFHQPFNSEEETVFRAVSTYLMGQFLKKADGQEPDWTLQGLRDIYQQVGAVNRAFARRLRSAVVMDANVNALIVLDSFAKTLPDIIDDKLVEFRHLFAATD
jgi:hypothetical protein